MTNPSSIATSFNAIFIYLHMASINATSERQIYIRAFMQAAFTAQGTEAPKNHHKENNREDDLQL